MTAYALSNQKFDYPPAARVAIAAVAGGLFAIALYGAIRWAIGIAPPTPWVRQTALAIHLWSVIPALPLGAYVLLTKKGGKRHKLLGRIWLGLMLITAGATIWIRNLNDGQFSWIHLFTVLTFIAVPQAIVSARKGNIAAHKKHMRNFFLGALTIAGGFSFLPGRTMWQWTFG